MFELHDTRPDFNVQEAEYKRLLGFPRQYVLEGRVRELADWAREWFAQHGQPWIYARQADALTRQANQLKAEAASWLRLTEAIELILKPAGGSR